jgi:hypothetical protein
MIPRLIPPIRYSSDFLLTEHLILEISMVMATPTIFLHHIIRISGDIMKHPTTRFLYTMQLLTTKLHITQLSTAMENHITLLTQHTISMLPHITLKDIMRPHTTRLTHTPQSTAQSIIKKFTSMSHIDIMS